MVGRTTQVSAREAAAELLRRSAIVRYMEYCDRTCTAGMRAWRLARARQLIEEARGLRSQFTPLP